MRSIFWSFCELTAGLALIAGFLGYMDTAAVDHVLIVVIFVALFCSRRSNKGV